MWKKKQNSNDIYETLTNHWLVLYTFTVRDNLLLTLYVCSCISSKFDGYNFHKHILYIPIFSSNSLILKKYKTYLFFASLVCKTDIKYLPTPVVGTAMISYFYEALYIFLKNSK